MMWEQMHVNEVGDGTTTSSTTTILYAPLGRRTATGFALSPLLGHSLLSHTRPTAFSHSLGFLCILSALNLTIVTSSAPWLAVSKTWLVCTTAILALMTVPLMSRTVLGPTYISSHYADNILSDVRPIKLKLEALRCLNVLLDEFLYNILSAAGSLSTDQLKAGLNKILPTPLGKEAILEAEVELKGYWERNTPHTPTKQDFDLQWSFEVRDTTCCYLIPCLEGPLRPSQLLRLKCEGYTTMNDTDEDSEAIKRVNDKMGVAGSLTPPHTSLLAPASLYLTAILECVYAMLIS